MLSPACIPVGAAPVALFVAAVVAVAPSIAQQDDPHLGTWVLNAEKSTAIPGPPLQRQTAVFSLGGHDLKVTAKGVTADGQPTLTEWTASYDGRDYPVQGNPDFDAVVLRRLDTHTIEFTRKLRGRVVQTVTSVVSPDGRTRTMTVTGVNARGQKIHLVYFYERQ